MLPNFLIIGAQKAGSSWLSKMLGLHPEIFVYPRGEVHFFDVQFEKGIDWYQEQFGAWAGEYAVGEKTPEYLNHPLAAERIKSALGGHVRLIVSLRHPVDRAYSAYWHGMKHGNIEPESGFVRAFATREKLRTAGMYGEHLKRFLLHFSRKNLLVFIFEEMMADRTSALSHCYSFLGVDEGYAPPSPEVHVNRAKDVVMFTRGLHVLRGQLKDIPAPARSLMIRMGRPLFRRLPRRREYTPIAAEVRRELFEYFTSDVELLEELLNRELSIWQTE